MPLATCHLPLNTQFLRSFGRIHGRPLRPEKQRLIDEVLPTCTLGIDAHGALTGATERLQTAKRIWLEIGFGGGEHMAAQAAAHPDVLYIGCEPYMNGVASGLSELKKRGAKNALICTQDARELLGALPASVSFERVFILFPDPWPKARHHKRRIVSAAMLDVLASRMPAGAELRLATDHVDYLVWMLERLSIHKAFQWLATRRTDWDTPPADWVPTRYEQKARAQGIRSTYLCYRRL